VTTTVDSYYTVSETAALLRLARPTVRNKIARGEIRAVRLGGARNSPLRVPLTELQRFLTPDAAAPGAGPAAGPTGAARHLAGTPSPPRRVAA